MTKMKRKDPVIEIRFFKLKKKNKKKTEDEV